MAELTQQLQQAQQQLQQSDAKRSSLNTENIGLRAQLKRTQRTSDAAESSASGAAAELASYQADIQERVSTDSESRLRSAGSTAELLEFELRRGELERRILVDALTSSYDMPEERLFDASRHEFMGRTRLVCIGCVKRGVAAKGLQELSMCCACAVLCCACAVHVLCMRCDATTYRARFSRAVHRVDTAVAVICARPSHAYVQCMCCACA